MKEASRSWCWPGECHCRLVVNANAWRGAMAVAKSQSARVRNVVKEARSDGVQARSGGDGILGVEEAGGERREEREGERAREDATLLTRVGEGGGS